MAVHASIIPVLDHTTGMTPPKMLIFLYLKAPKEETSFLQLQMCHFYKTVDSCGICLQNNEVDT
jgi:hypothetical protein